MARFLLLLYIYMLSDISLALYEDEVGVFDWRLQHIGRAKYIYFDQSSQSGKRIIVATEDAALAVVNTRTGGIVWRRIFEEPIDYLLHQKSLLVSISSGGTLLRSWDIASGYLQWEVAVQNSYDPNSFSQDVQVDGGWGSGEVKVALAENVVLILGNGRLTAISCKRGDKLWSVEINNSDHDYRAIHSLSDHVLVFSVKDQSLLVLSKYSLTDGQLTSTEELSSELWLSGECLVLHSVLVCLGEKEKLLKSVGLEGELDKLSSFSFEDTDYHLRHLFVNTLKRRNEFLLVGIQSQYLISATQKSVRMMQEFPAGLMMIGLLDSKLLTVVVKYMSEKEVSVGCWEVGSNGKMEELSHTIEMSTFRGTPVKGAVHLFHKTDNGVGYRAAILWEDSSISLLHQTGRIVWSREEALTRISALDFVGLPSAHYGSQAFPVMSDKEQSGNMLTMFLQRFYGQLLQIQDTVSSFSRDGINYWLRDEDSEKMLGDQFGLKKIIVMATENGKLYGMDSSDGHIVWQSFLPDVRTFQSNNKYLLYQLRSAVHYPFPPVAILLAQSKGGCHGTVIYSFNPLVGVAGVEPICLPGHMIQTALLPATNQEHSRILIMLMDNQQILVYPPSSHVSFSNIFMFVVNKTTNDVIGYTITDTDSSHDATNGYYAMPTPAQLLWRVHIPNDQQIIDIKSHHNIEHVSSQARVMNDGSVIYKYLNPNLVVMATQSNDPSKYLLNVHLIDGVSGHVIFTAHHRQCSGPVHVIHSENWIIYHYLNVKLRRHELGVLELYQNADSENSTVWSSLNSPPKPLVFKQSFIFPSSITSLATSSTSQGITHKTVIVGLPSGHLISMPKLFLDPMRTLETTDFSSASGAPPYVPVLPVNSTFFINYNQTIEKLSGITMSPSGIESTSLLLAHGIGKSPEDLFFTRVSPSKLFDVLADDFNYALVSSVLVGMLCIAIVTRKLSSRRLLKTAWQ